MKIISTRREEAVVFLTLNRPDKRNALNRTLIRALKEELEACDAEASVRCVVLTGAPPSFSVGADISEIRSLTFEQMYNQDYLEDWNCVLSFEKPILACVDGHALGGGFELALMADIILCTPQALFGLPELTLGVIPGAGGAQRLCSIVGKARTMELCLTGRFLSAEEARAWGVVTQIIEREDLLDKAHQLAQNIALKSPLAVKALKESIHSVSEGPLSAALESGRYHFYSLFGTEGQKSGMDAFLSKSGSKKK